MRLSRLFCAICHDSPIQGRLGRAPGRFCASVASFQRDRFRRSAGTVAVLLLLSARCGHGGQAGSQARPAAVDEASAAEARYRLARSLQANNRPAESLKMFTEAAAMRRPSGEDLRLVALDYVLLNDAADARHWLLESVALEPRNTEAWYDMARNEMTIGDYAKAEAAVRKALALEPRLVKAENNLGLILEALNRPDEAERAYRQAVAWQAGLATPSEQPLLNFGLLLNSRGRSAEALPMLEQAVLLRPDDASAQAAMARARANTGDVAGAIASMRKAVALDGENPRLHFQLGQLLRQHGDKAESAAELARSRQLYGQHSSEPGAK